jgi:stage II sporulation protein M
MINKEKILNKLNKIVRVPDKSIYRYTLFLAIFFVFSMLLGFYATLSQPEETSYVFEQILAKYSELDSLGPITLFLLIFFNNIVITLVMMVSGILFALPPIVFVWANGFVFGIAMPIIGADLGFTTVILGILPHGIIEIPAALLSAGYGMWLGKKSYRALRYKEPLVPSIKKALEGYLQYILPLFFLAACIETFITKFILDAIVV